MASRAQGLAQFIAGQAPMNAAARSLRSVQACRNPRSFERIAPPVRHLGLPRAYNAAAPGDRSGWPAPVDAAGDSTLVRAITGTTVDDLAAAARTPGVRPRGDVRCARLMASMRRAPNHSSRSWSSLYDGRAENWGGAMSAGFSRDKALARYFCARLKRLSAGIGNQDPSCWLAAAQPPGHPDVIPGADRRRHAARRRR